MHTSTVPEFPRKGRILPSTRCPSPRPIASELVAEDESLAGLVQEFLDGMNQRLAEFDSALASSDYPRLRAIAHQLKGSGGGYGYPMLTERAAELERQARDAEAEACRRSVEALKALAARLAVRSS